MTVLEILQLSKMTFKSISGNLQYVHCYIHPYTAYCQLRDQLLPSPSSSETLTMQTPSALYERENLLLAHVSCTLGLHLQI